MLIANALLFFFAGFETSASGKKVFFVGFYLYHKILVQFRIEKINPYI